MLTAAVRDLHRCYPGRFLTDVRTSCPQLWENNPFITKLEDKDLEARLIECHYPLIQQSNQRPYHFIHGFIDYLNQQLRLEIKPTEFRGDIYLSDLEKSWYSQAHEICGDDRSFWLIAAGGKYDFTNKWWDVKRYQQVVNYFQGKILFVQVGSADHYHPPLEGVIDLRGKTNVRQLVRLMYHAQGVLCPVTLLMHLAAAVPTKAGTPAVRPCVVIAGGREPSHWEAYPHHQFIHTIGALACCETGGCWKSRVLPLGDGDEKDRPENLCVDVVGNLPRCMDMIAVDEVIHRIERYFVSGIHKYLDASVAAPKTQTQMVVWPALLKEYNLTLENAARVSDEVIESIPSYPKCFRGSGIVICAGGVKYFTNAWVCINMLRALGCNLPIQIWHLGQNELDDTMKGLASQCDVECVDAELLRDTHPCRMLDGWELKPYAMIHSPFREVFLIDADNLPLINPEELFKQEEYLQTGAVFWPDYGRLAPKSPVWGIFGVSYRPEAEFETGQILINKEVCWNPLMLTMWYNANSDFYYQFVHGDKETFHMAFRRLNVPYAMTSRRIVSLHGCVMCQHDFKGKRIFQHRNLAKWELNSANRHIPGFLHEAECRAFIRDLSSRWPGVIENRLRCDPNDEVTRMLKDNVFEYSRLGHGSREMTFNADGTIGRGAGGMERRWDLRRSVDQRIFLEIFGEDILTCALELCQDGVWRGRWRRFGKAVVEVRIKCVSERRKGTTDDLVWRQIYEENAYRLPTRFHPDDIIIDIGAHIGSFACACVARGAKYIYSYEPDPENFSLASRNIKRWLQIYNSQERHHPACVENLAIWRSDQIEGLAITKYPTLPGETQCVDMAGVRTTKVGNGGASCRSISLDTILNELPKVTLLKLHCEGAEWPILLGSKSLAKIERIIVKLHPITEEGGCRSSSQLASLCELSTWNFDSLMQHLKKQGLLLAGDQPYLEGNGLPRHDESAAGEFGPFFFHRADC